MKNYLALILAAITLCITSCRKPRQGDFEMILNGTKVTTTVNSSGTVISTTQYANTQSYRIKKSRKTSVEVGDMIWKRSGDNVSYTSSNLSVSTFFNSNSPQAVTETIVITYDGIIKSNSSIEGDFVFSITRVDNQTEEIQVTTGSFVLQRK